MINIDFNDLLRCKWFENNRLLLNLIYLKYNFDVFNGLAY